MTIHSSNFAPKLSGLRNSKSSESFLGFLSKNNYNPGIFIRIGKIGSLGPWSRVIVYCNKLYFCQNDPPIGESFWQKERLLQYTMTLLQGPKRSCFDRPNIYIMCNDKTKNKSWKLHSMDILLVSVARPTWLPHPLFTNKNLTKYGVKCQRIHFCNIMFLYIFHKSNMFGYVKLWKTDFKFQLRIIRNSYRSFYGK